MGLIVAEHRHAYRWSLDALARESGVDRRTLMNVEAGRHEPRLGTLIKLSGALQVPLADLVAPVDPVDTADK